jgi:hypothetical protein
MKGKKHVPLWDSILDRNLFNLVVEMDFDFQEISSTFNSITNSKNYTPEVVRKRWAELHKKRKNGEKAEGPVHQDISEALNQMSKSKKDMTLQEILRNVPDVVKNRPKTFLDVTAADLESGFSISAITGKKITPNSRPFLIVAKAKAEVNVYIRDPSLSEGDILKQKEQELNEFFSRLDASSILPEDMGEELYVFFPLQLENGQIIIEKIKNEDNIARFIKKDPHRLRTQKELEKLRQMTEEPEKEKEPSLIEETPEKEEEKFEETMKELKAGSKGYSSMNFRNPKENKIEEKKAADPGEFAFDEEEDSDEESD